VRLTVLVVEGESDTRLLLNAGLDALKTRPNLVERQRLRQREIQIFGKAIIGEVASDSAIITINVPILLWRALFLRLRRQSAGTRESGAFLLGRQNTASGRVTRFICYDSLDPHAYQSGAIAFHAPGYAALWQYCRQHKLEVLADVHTHPGANVCQSPIDQNNPMVPVVGHAAMILPHFARTWWWSLQSVGVYEYLGHFNWRTHRPSENPQRITLSLW
jgi:hypothetical protein